MLKTTDRNGILKGLAFSCFFPSPNSFCPSLSLQNLSICLWSGTNMLKSVHYLGLEAKKEVSLGRGGWGWRERELLTVAILKEHE